MMLCLSCRHNRLKTNEKDLVNDIILRENEKLTGDKAAFETNNKKSGRLKLKENRSIDPQMPPIKIDIPGAKGNERNFKLSDIASSVRYIKLQTPPDTSLLFDLFYTREDLDSHIMSDGTQIIFQGLFGLSRFNMQGDYQETIWKNETGIRFSGNNMVAFGGKDFFGVPFNIPANINNGDIYFSFLDGPSGNGQVMKYRTGTNKVLSSQSDVEIPGLALIPGDTLFSTKQSTQNRFSRIFGTSSDTWAGINKKWNAGSSGTLLVTYNNKGDTLCQFSDFERIKNFNNAVYRNAVELASYSFNNVLTIKQEYNDTVFRLIQPDRLLPVFILDFGSYKCNYSDGFNPNFDLSEKFMIKSIHESTNYLFIRYTQNHDSPLNRKNKTVKFYNTIFYKKESKLYHQSGSSLLPKGITNDIDGGLPFWPEFITQQGEMMRLVSGKALKDYMNSSSFKSSNISEENRQKQISMISGLKNTDMIIMIVK